MLLFRIGDTTDRNKSVFHLLVMLQSKDNSDILFSLYKGKQIKVLQIQ